MLNRSWVFSKIQSCSGTPSVHSKRTTGAIPLGRGGRVPVGVCVGTLEILGSIVTHMFAPGSIILSNKNDREKRQVNSDRIPNLCQWI